MSNQDALKKELAAISKRKENALCADCRMPQPTWASFNLGLFMCMNCAGHHRSLGTHISRVRSTTMDNWDAASVALMGSVGNVRANAFWENRLPPTQRINPTVNENVRGDYIRAKYAQRAWYAAPEAGAVAAASAAATAQEPQEARQLSKMEQRQARLAQQAKAATPTPAPVPQPSVTVRQTSTPLPANNRPAAAAAAAAPQPTLFSGMAPSAAAAAPVVAPPVKQAPLREHSASPWVSKSEFQQPQQQQPQQQFVPQQSYQPQAHQHQAAVSAPVVNLLDLSSVSDTPAVHPAPGHAVDDMFSGLSLADHSSAAAAHPHVNTSAGGVATGSDLMSYYAANEPASAPARSQHPQSSASPDIFGGVVAGSSYDNHSAAPSSFSFISGGGGGESSEDVGATASSSADAASSAFSFLGVSSADPPPPALDGSDFGALLAPAAAAAFPVPNMLSFGADGSGSNSPPLLVNSHSFNGAGSNGFLGGAPLQQQQPMQPSLSHSYSQPVDMFNPVRPLQQQQQQQPVSQYGHSYGAPNGLGGSGGGGVPPLASLPAFGAPFNSSPAVPQFTVQSVQATQKAQAVAAQEMANDPFAHIEVQMSPQPLQQQQQQQQQSYGGYPSAGSPGVAPKQPHQCDVDGCEGKKVSRGLCSKHLRGGEAPMQQQQQQQQPAPSTVDSSFSFLAAPQQQQLQQQQSAVDSSFSFLAQPAPVAADSNSGAASSFSFLS